MTKTNQIYLVDDDAEMRQATAQWLELTGFQVRCFADAASVLPQLRQGLEAVVISDIRMPKMDGMELLGRIKEIDGEIPVLLITAHGDVQLAVEAMRQGAYMTLSKNPMNPSVCSMSQGGRAIMCDWSMRTASCAGV